MHGQKNIKSQSLVAIIHCCTERISVSNCFHVRGMTLRPASPLPQRHQRLLACSVHCVTLCLQTFQRNAFAPPRASNNITVTYVTLTVRGTNTGPGNLDKCLLNMQKWENHNKNAKQRVQEERKLTYHLNIFKD